MNKRVLEYNQIDWPKQLRLLVNRVCNYNCSFPDSCEEWCHRDGVNTLTGKNNATSDDFLFLAETLKKPLKLEKAKIGALEPLFYKDIFKLLKGLKKLNYKEVSMTTNGYLLEDKLKQIEDTGLDILTVSMHVFNREGYKSITRVDGFDRVKRAIEKATRRKFKQVKVNRVLLNFDNLWSDLMSFLDWSTDFGLRVKLYKLIWSPGINEKKYFDYHVAWESLLAYLNENAIIVNIDDYSVPARTRLVWKFKSGLLVETDDFNNKLSPEMPKICRDCQYSSVCQEGLMSYGVEVNSELKVSGCLLRHDVVTDLWDAVSKRDGDRVLSYLVDFVGKTTKV